MWLEPKTNWQPTDYINVEDFNRIRGNIEYLREKAKKYYLLRDPNLPQPDRVSRSSYAYAEYWNALEEHMQTLTDSIPFFNVGHKKVYYALGSYIDFNELNRLEKACEIYYNMLIGQDNTVRTLPFTLGNDGGIEI